MKPSTTHESSLEECKANKDGVDLEGIDLENQSTVSTSDECDDEDGDIQKPKRVKRWWQGRSHRWYCKVISISILVLLAVGVLACFFAYWYGINHARASSVSVPMINVVDIKMDNGHINAAFDYKFVTTSNSPTKIFLEPGFVNLYYKDTFLARIDLALGVPLAGYGQLVEESSATINHVEQIEHGMELMKEVESGKSSVLTFRGALDSEEYIGVIKIPFKVAVECSLEVDWATKTGVTTCKNKVIPSWERGPR